MKYGIKPNQSQIVNLPSVTKKEIIIIEIDPENKTVKQIKLPNSLSFFQKHCNFYKSLLLQFEKDSFDHFVVNNDEDSKTRKSFEIKDISKTCYGKSVVVKIPKSHDYEKLQSTKVTVQTVLDRIVFND